MSKDKKYQTESPNLQEAIKKARGLLNTLAKEYSLDIAKRAFFRVQREVSKKQALLERKKELEKEIDKLNKSLELENK